MGREGDGGAVGVERGEVHWPGKGKGSKTKKTVWRCALLETEEADVEDLERPLAQPEQLLQPPEQPSQPLEQPPRPKLPPRPEQPPQSPQPKQPRPGRGKEREDASRHF